MQLVEIGRNEPCACGSGKKYKKCCLAKRDQVIAGNPNDLDVVALVDRAIADDDWELVHDVFDAGFELFDPGAPLEHVRFRHDAVSSRLPASGELSRWCSAGWPRRCEQEIVYALDHHDLEIEERDGLRLAVHLLRRFGAASPLVEAIATLQIAEHRIRARKLGDTLSRFGLTVHDVDSGLPDVLEWIERERPEILMFADWFSLRATPREDVENLWFSGISTRICDVSLTLAEEADRADARHRLQLAATTLLGGVPRLGVMLAQRTPARVTTADERAVYEMIVNKAPNERLRGAIGRIVMALEARCDFAGAAMLRETQQRVQNWFR